MARTDRSKKVESANAGKYRDTAIGFLKAAEDLATIAGEDEVYGGPIALLAVHTAISYADTVAIAYSGRKSTSGDHEQSVSQLTSVLGAAFPKSERSRLLKLAKLKDSVAYQGNRFHLEDALLHLDAAVKFSKWAEQMYQRRPV